jgi:excisionase family DNA binding protein
VTAFIRHRTVTAHIMRAHGAVPMTAKPFEPLCLRVDDACAALGISRTTFYQLVRAGKLEVRKIGTKTSRVTVESLRQFFDGLPSGAGDYPVKHATKDAARSKAAAEASLKETGLS